LHLTMQSPPSPHDLIFNPKGKQMASFFHVMISYRVSTEAALARQMFDRLMLNSLKLIPAAGKSQWPVGFEKQRPGDINVFLDQFCLKSGEKWKRSDEGGGFIGALMKSLIFVPLLSWKVELVPESKDNLESKNLKRFRGSVGEMVARYSGLGGEGQPPLNTPIDPNPNSDKFHDAVDNVLLELILAMELHAHLKKNLNGSSCIYPCFRLFPIIVDTFPDSKQLPDHVSKQTYDEASKHLNPLGIFILESEMKTVRGIVKHFFDFQAVKFSDFGVEDFALNTVCSKIISAVCDDVSKIDPLSLFESRPLCDELHNYLSERSCSYMTRILAANNITSLRQLSFLTHPNAIYDLAKQCSTLSSKSAVAELSTLTSVIEESKHNKASWLLSVRLDRFIDRDASFATVIKSSSGLIISCAQKSWLTMYFIIGVVLFIVGMMSVFSSGPGGNTIFDFIGSAFLFGVCLGAVAHSPKRGYRLLHVSIHGGWSCHWILFRFLQKRLIFSQQLDQMFKCSRPASDVVSSMRYC